MDDREGMMGPMLSAMLKIPCVSVVTRVDGGSSGVTVKKEYFGGLMAAFDVQTPAVWESRQQDKLQDTRL